MALINCPECGKEVSDKARICINCGYPIEELVNKETDGVVIGDITTINGVEINLRAIFDENQPAKTDAIKEVSDKAEIDILDAKKIVDEYWKNHQKEIDEKNKYWCTNCYRQNEIGRDYCAFCNHRLTPYYKTEQLEINKEKEQEEIKEFNGVYRYTFLGGKQEVYCPRCGSCECSHFTKVIPEKTKTRYTANLNPLKPFTFVNKKEKVVRKEKEEKMFICNKCGKEFY